MVIKNPHAVVLWKLEHAPESDYDTPVRCIATLIDTGALSEPESLQATEHLRAMERPWLLGRSLRRDGFDQDHADRIWRPDSIADVLEDDSERIGDSVSSCNSARRGRATAEGTATGEH